jgi:hypothetical protein
VKLELVFYSSEVAADYAKPFRAVNWNDHDSADDTTTIRTKCCYLNAFFWVLHRVEHFLFVVVVVFCLKIKHGHHIGS